MPISKHVSTDHLRVKVCADPALGLVLELKSMLRETSREIFCSKYFTLELIFWSHVYWSTVITKKYTVYAYSLCVQIPCFNINLCSYCMCYNITVKTSFTSCKSFVDGKMNTKSCGFHLVGNPVNKIVNIEKDNKENISDKV